MRRNTTARTKDMCPVCNNLDTAFTLKWIYFVAQKNCTKSQWQDVNGCNRHARDEDFVRDETNFTFIKSLWKFRYISHSTYFCHFLVRAKKINKFDIAQPACNGTFVVNAARLNVICHECCTHVSREWISHLRSRRKCYFLPRWAFLLCFDISP